MILISTEARVRPLRRARPAGATLDGIRRLGVSGRLPHKSEGKLRGIPLEPAGGQRRALDVPHVEQPAGGQQPLHISQGRTPRRRIQIDQQVAAEDDIQRRRIGQKAGRHQVTALKLHGLPNFVFDLVLPLTVVEVASAQTQHVRVRLTKRVLSELASAARCSTRWLMSTPVT